MTSTNKGIAVVTGAAGALAQKVIEQLRDTCDLVAVDFREQVYLGDDIPSYCIDFNKRVFEDLFRRYEFDGVIHMGRIMSSQLTRMRRYNANVLGTQKLLDRRRKVLGPAYSHFYRDPVHLVRAEGVWMWDAEGRKYLDCYNNVASVGHCHPEVVEALHRSS